MEKDTEDSTRRMNVAENVVRTNLGLLYSIVEEHRLDVDGDLSSSLKSLDARLASNEVRLVILGEFSAGKTTFVNSLLDTALLHTGILPTTAVCTSIRYGARAECDVLLKNSQWVSIALEEIGMFAVEGSRSNDVTEVELKLPSVCLANGLVIVDTPGVNVNIDQHEAITATAIESANACVYLMDARQPGKKTTIDFLRQIRKKIDKFFFVLNRADILDPSEQKEALEYVKDALIRECGIPEPRVELISSIPSPEGPWRVRFDAFKERLNEFMQSERDSVICAELARLLDCAIIRSEHLVNSNFRLAEQELAAHYKTSMPDALEIVNALEKEVSKNVKNDIGDARNRFPDLHTSECRELRRRVEAIISSHSTIEALVDSAPREISATFETHLRELESFITGAFEKTFEGWRDEVIATFQRLFSNVRWLEQKAYFSRIGGWVAVGAGLLLLPLLEWLLNASRECLMISPFLGASAGIVIYGASYWVRARSMFSPPESPSIAFAFDVHSALRQGFLFQNAANNPLEPNFAPFQIGRAAGLLAGNPWLGAIGAAVTGVVYGLQKLWEVASRKLERLRNEMRESLRPMLDRFESETREGAASVFISGEQRTIAALSSLIENSMERYETILDRLLKPRRQIRGALEQRRNRLRENAMRLTASREAVLDSLRTLEIQLKGTASSYAEPDATDLGEITSNSERVSAVEISRMFTSETQEPNKSLALGWTACFLATLVLTFMSFSVSGALPSRTQPDDVSAPSAPGASRSTAAQATSNELTTSQEMKPAASENVPVADSTMSQAESAPTPEVATESPATTTSNDGTPAAENNPLPDGNRNSETGYDHANAPNKPNARRLNTQALRMLSETPPDLSGATLALEEAAQLAPSDVEVLNNLGDVYGRVGNFRSAEAVLNRVLVIAPNRRVAQGNLGYVEAKLGKVVVASSHFCLYVRQFNSLEKGKSTLERVMNDPDPNVQSAVGLTVSNCAH